MIFSVLHQLSLFIVDIDIMNIDGSRRFRKGNPFTLIFFAAKTSGHHNMKHLHNRKSTTRIDSTKEPLFSILNHWWKHLDKKQQSVYKKTHTLHIAGTQRLALITQSHRTRGQSQTGERSTAHRYDTHSGIRNPSTVAGARHLANVQVHAEGRHTRLNNLPIRSWCQGSDRNSDPY